MQQRKQSLTPICESPQIVTELHYQSRLFVLSAAGLSCVGTCVCVCVACRCVSETSNSVPVAGELNRKHAVSGDSGVRVSRSQSPKSTRGTRPFSGQSRQRAGRSVVHSDTGTKRLKAGHTVVVCDTNSWSTWHWSTTSKSCRVWKGKNRRKKRGVWTRDSEDYSCAGAAVTGGRCSWASAVWFCTAASRPQGGQDLSCLEVPCWATGSRG